MIGAVAPLALSAFLLAAARNDPASSSHSSPETCAALAADGSPESLAALPTACPDLTLSAERARALLLQCGDLGEVRATLPLLRHHPDLTVLAQLALEAPAPTVAAAVPAPRELRTTPPDAAVRAIVARAHAQRLDATASDEDRTRAEAVLALIYVDALSSLGEPAAAPPFVRLLAGRALHHARTFCARYWQRRVAGLERPFAAVEDALEAAVLRLQASPPHGDDALLAHEIGAARRWVLAPTTARRIAARRGTPEGRAAALAPLTAELERLIASGLPDTAFERAVSVAPSHGTTPVVAALRSASADASPEDREFLERRVAALLTRTPPVPPTGPTPLPHAIDPPWATAAELAEALVSRLEGTTEPTAGTRMPPGPAATRPALEWQLARRPDVLRALLARAGRADAPPALRAVAPWFEAVARARDPRSGEGTLQEADAGLRRAYAQAARDARLPTE